MTIEAEPAAPGAPAPPPHGMGRRAVSGAMMVGGAQGIRVLLTMLSTIVVSRLLSPSDYGVVAMTSPVTGFILLFQTLELDQAVVQSKEISHAQLNGLFWIGMIASFVIMVVFVLISPAVGWFYHDARAGYVVAASAATVLFSGSALQHTALLNRDMRFTALSSMMVANAAVTFIVTVAMAMWLRSYWALWWGSFAGTLAQVAMVWWLDHWRPTLPVDFSGVGRMVRFGGSITGFSVINFFSRNLDKVLIARVRGAIELGLYDRSYKLMMFPLDNINQPLARVMLPILSRLQDEPVRYRRSFLIALRAIQLVAIPLMAVAVANSDRVVPFLLGARWQAAAPTFFWLGLAGLLQPLGNATGWIFISRGRGMAMMKWGLVSAVVTVGGFIIGLHWGATGVACSFFITALGRTPPLLHYSCRGSSVRPIDLYKLLADALITAAVTWAFAHYVAYPLPFFWQLVASGLVAVLTILACYAVVPDGRLALQEILFQARVPGFRKKAVA